VLPLRIGIAAGRVIVFEGDDFIGMSINLASRLCDAAAPGEILANDEVIKALGDAFPVISLGERQIPGIISPIPVWRVAAPEVEDELPLSFVE
jgi:adenylate cyclase